MFTSLAISGGAMKVLAAIGCIRYLEEHHLLSSIKHYAGTSFGAIISFMLALEYSSQEMEDFFISAMDDPAITHFDTEQALFVLDTFGLNNGENMMHLLRRILQRKTFKKDITFMDLAKTKGKNLVICVANLTDEREEFFNVDTHPAMSVLLAVRMSCSIPILLAPVRWQDKLYVDGGIYNNFPVNYFKDRRLKDILGINVVVRRTKSDFHGSIWEYLVRIIQTVVDKANEQHNIDAAHNICKVEMEDIEWFSLSEFRVTMTADKIKQFIEVGYATIQQRLLLRPAEPSQTE